MVLWIAGWAFVLATWLLAWLLSSLFGLIGVDALHTLLLKGWFDALLAGGRSALP